MNLYEIKVIHYSQKDSHESIQEYLIAKSDEDVFDYLKIEDNKDYYPHWYYIEREGEIERLQEIFDNKGDFHEEVSDLYYGATQFGWRLKAKNLPQAHVDTLVETGVVKVIAEGGVVIWEKM